MCNPREINFTVEHVELQTHQRCRGWIDTVHHTACPDSPAPSVLLFLLLSSSFWVTSSWPSSLHVPLYPSWTTKFPQVPPDVFRSSSCLSLSLVPSVGCNNVLSSLVSSLSSYALPKSLLYLFPCSSFSPQSSVLSFTSCSTTVSDFTSLSSRHLQSWSLFTFSSLCLQKIWWSKWWEKWDTERNEWKEGEEETAHSLTHLLPFPSRSLCAQQYTSPLHKYQLPKRPGRAELCSVFPKGCV